MTWAVELLAHAEEELARAKDWYSRCHPHLQADLLLCVEEALARMARNPFALARAQGEFRQAFVHRFPYRIVFLPVVDRIVVVAILHTRRHPRTWITREH